MTKWLDTLFLPKDNSGKRGQTFILRAGFEPDGPMSARSKTVRGHRDRHLKCTIRRSLRINMCSLIAVRTYFDNIGKLSSKKCR
jgi:hypothetical protein